MITRNMNAHTDIHMYTYTHAHTDRYAHTSGTQDIHMYTNTHAHIDRYAHTYHAHTDIHTYTYTHAHIDRFAHPMLQPEFLTTTIGTRGSLTWRPRRWQKGHPHAGKRVPPRWWLT